MTAALIPTPVMQFLDADGNPLVGGKVYTYAAGTSTPLATFTDYGGATPNANPVILNSRGEASIWFGTAAYKLELYTAATVLIWTADNVSASTPVVYGTGVAAALAINVGTAGSIVVNGGVLGTPSSGLVTNLTGTASININGTVGATTANTGAFTTLSASGTSTMAAINASGATTFTNAGGGKAFGNTTSGVNFVYAELLNTSGDTIWGTEGSSAGTILTGSAAFASVFASTVAKSLHLGTSNTVRLTIDSAGAVTIPGTLAFGSGTAGTVGSWTSSTGSSKTGFFYADATYAGISTGSAQTGQGLVLTATAVTLMVANSGVLTATAGSSSTSGIQLNAYTTNGTVTTTGSTGILSSASDATLKTHDGFVVNPLDMLAGLKARYYFWNHELGKEEPAQRQLGFFAQDVNEHLGDEAANPPKGDAKWGYYDRSVLAVAVEAIKELAADFQAYKNSHP